MMMPLSVALQPASLGPMLLQALDTLEAEGYTFWMMEEAEVEDDYPDGIEATGNASECPELDGLRICFDALPADLPVLPGEIELLASVFDDLLFLASLEERAAGDIDAEVRTNVPRSAVLDLPR